MKYITISVVIILLFVNGYSQNIKRDTITSKKALAVDGDFIYHGTVLDFNDSTKMYVISLSDTMGSFQVNLGDTSMIASLVVYGSGTLKIGTTANSNNVMLTQDFTTKTQISFSNKIVPPVLYFTTAGTVSFRLWYNKIYGTEAD